MDHMPIFIIVRNYFLTACGSLTLSEPERKENEKTQKRSKLYYRSIAESKKTEYCVYSKVGFSTRKRS